MNFSKNNFPEIVTERLLLNAASPDDVTSIVQYAGDAPVAALTLNIPHPYNEEDALSWLKMLDDGLATQSELVFAIRILKSPELVGAIGLHIDAKHQRAEIGYWLARHLWNKGFATEALAAVIKFAFEQLQLNKVTAHFFSANPASGRVMEKCGMLQEGYLHEHIVKQGVKHDVILFGLTLKQYQERN